MTKITSFMRPEHALVSARVLEALKTLETELGLTFRAAGGIVGQTDGMIKLEVKVLQTAAGGDALKQAFEYQCHMVGLKPEDYKRTFWDRGTLYRIVGVQISRPKFPIEVVRVHDSKSFKFTKSGVLTGLANEAKRTAA